MNEAIFSTAYLPSISYISELIRFSSIKIEQHENFHKQTLRNRCHILSANGILTLPIPVQHEQKIKIPVRDLKISYRESWQRIHWASLKSAYNKSPFFEYYKDDFEKILFSNKTFLLDLNTELVQLILKIIGRETKLNFTNEYEKQYPETDFRFLSDAKTTLNLTCPDSIGKPQTLNLNYPQVFSYKYGFTPNLSIVDLIFNQGTACGEYL